MQPTPAFRRALPAEASTLTQIALAAKQSWGYPPEWMAAWRADLIITPGYIVSSPVWVAEVAHGCRLPFRPAQGPELVEGLPARCLSEVLRAAPETPAKRVAGFLGLVYVDDQWFLEHLWVRPDFHGCGLGRLLFGEAVRQARAVGATALGIKSDPNAESFYLKMGAVRTGLEVYELPGNIRREVPQLSYRL
jgi:GNAT superfamily N-acetyltransferase